jgi:hypothetical protein
VLQVACQELSDVARVELALDTTGCVLEHGIPGGEVGRPSPR